MRGRRTGRRKKKCNTVFNEFITCETYIHLQQGHSKSKQWPCFNSHSTVCSRAPDARCWPAFIKHSSHQCTLTIPLPASRQIVVSTYYFHGSIIIYSKWKNNDLTKIIKITFARDMHWATEPIHTDIYLALELGFWMFGCLVGCFFETGYFYIALAITMETSVSLGLKAFNHHSWKKLHVFYYF